MSTAAQRLRRLQAALAQRAPAALRRKLAAADRRLTRGAPIDRLLAELERAAETELAAIDRRAAQELTLAYPPALPISQRHDELLAALRAHRVCVITGETGSGKTTQLPKLCWEAGSGRSGAIALTQPRRLAALAMAERLREECQVAEPVIAHAVRFDDRRQAETTIGVCTDGLLLAELAGDRRLDRYDCLIIDEAHERSVNIDLLLGLLHRLLRQRPDLRLVITSASIDAERFAAHFQSAIEAPVPVIAVAGRQYPVTIDHRADEEDDLAYLDAAVRCIRELPLEGESGDVLCFLPSERDILEARRRLDREPGTTVLPLFGRLSASEQRAIFAQQRGRKVVLATNIAETSVTVPGITVVIDAGLARIKRFSATTRTERLPIEAVAQASCLQRAGRAGRVAPGRCIRLYSATDFARRPAHTDPELLRANLAGVLLQCLRMGIHDPSAFPWLDAPRAGAWARAREVLEELGAVDTARQGRLLLTARGRAMAQMPCDPTVARMLLAGLDAGIAQAVATVAAFCSIQDPRLRPAGEERKADAAQAVFRQEGGDLATVLALWEAYQAVGGSAAKKRFTARHFLSFRRMREWADVRHQLLATLREQGRGRLPPSASTSLDLSALHRAVLAGQLGGVLRHDVEERCYRMAAGKAVHIHPSSSLAPRNRQEQKQAALPWLVACEIVETSRVFARLCAPIDPAWIIPLAGDRLTRRYGTPYYEAGSGQVVCEERLAWRGLAIREHTRVPAQRIDAAAAHTVFIDQALAAGALRAPLPILRANERLRRRILALRERLREGSIVCERAQLAALYHARLATWAPICDDRALLRLLRDQGPGLLAISAGELIDPALWERAQAFPEHLRLGGQTYPLHWRYVPGEPDDGATLRLPEQALADCDPALLDAAIPGWCAARVLAWLRTLPKAERRQLIPLAGNAERLAARIHAEGGDWASALARMLAEEYGLRAHFTADQLPAHLRLRLIIEADGVVVFSGRDLASLRIGGLSTDPLAALRARHEVGPLDDWRELPWDLRFDGHPLTPGLLRSRAADAGVAARIHLFRHDAACTHWHGDGVLALAEAHLASDITAALASEPPSLRRIAELNDQAIGGLRRHLLLAIWRDSEPGTIRDTAAWTVWITRLRAELPAQMQAVDDLLVALARADHALLAALRRPVKRLDAAGLQSELTADRARLLAAGWWERLPWVGLLRLPLYLRACTSALEATGRAARQALRSEAERLRQRSTWRQWQCLGLVSEWRQAQLQLEENALVAVSGTGAGLPGTHPMRLRQQLQGLEAALDAHADWVHTQRHGLLVQRPFLERAAAEPLRDRLLAGLDELLRRFPDYSLGADLDQQAADLHDCSRAIRRYLG